MGLLLTGLMGEPEEPSPLPFFILIESVDGFDLSPPSETTCSRLLWVRCGSAMGMLKAGNLLVWDGNMPFVQFDASGLAAHGLILASRADFQALHLLAQRPWKDLDPELRQLSARPVTKMSLPSPILTE